MGGVGAGTGEGGTAAGGSAAAYPVTAAGEAMVKTLVAAHGLLRRDLDSLDETLRLLASGDAARVSEVRGRVDALSMRQAAWQLRSFCETYCQTVHAHHSIEDFRIFPAVLGVAPELAPIVDRLTADHVELGRRLDTLMSSLDALPGPEPVWKAAQDAVRELGELLAEHLGLEEERILPHLGRLPDWV
ncbi:MULTISPECIES: hemerythrin domain-containing protein [Streptomyces]|uniref:Hemerythrin domain-containing protein n=2 Tax=Streptomyces TaxID=1883 RepID=A0ABV9IT22_9ACTN